MRLARLITFAGLLAFAPAAPAQPPPAVGARVGDTAPDFSLQDLQGGRHSRAGLMRGVHTLVLHFWNTV